MELKLKQTKTCDARFFPMIKERNVQQCFTEALRFEDDAGFKKPYSLLHSSSINLILTGLLLTSQESSGCILCESIHSPERREINNLVEPRLMQLEIECNCGCNDDCRAKSYYLYRYTVGNHSSCGPSCWTTFCSTNFLRHSVTGYMSKNHDELVDTRAALWI